MEVHRPNHPSLWLILSRVLLPRQDTKVKVVIFLWSPWDFPSRLMWWIILMQTACIKLQRVVSETRIITSPFQCPLFIEGGRLIYFGEGEIWLLLYWLCRQHQSIFHMLYTMYMNSQHIYPHLEFSDIPPSIVVYTKERLQRALSHATKMVYSPNRTQSESDLQEKQIDSPITNIMQPPNLAHTPTLQNGCSNVAWDMNGRAAMNRTILSTSDQHSCAGTLSSQVLFHVHQALPP